MGALNPMGSTRGFRSRKTLELVLSVRFNQMDVPASSSYLWELLSKSFFFFFSFFPSFIHIGKILPGVGWENYSCWAFCLDPSIPLNRLCYSDGGRG